jgi:hypothetical protein
MARGRVEIFDALVFSLTTRVDSFKDTELVSPDEEVVGTETSAESSFFSISFAVPIRVEQLDLAVVVVVMEEIEVSDMVRRLLSILGSGTDLDEVFEAEDAAEVARTHCWEREIMSSSTNRVFSGTDKYLYSSFIFPLDDLCMILLS